MRSMIQRVLFAVLLSVLISCGDEKVAEVAVEEALQSVKGEIVELPVQEIVVEQPKLTSDDVRKAILSQWQEEWPEKAKKNTLDISLQLFRAAEEEKIDPIIVANEYMELLRTTMDIQPALKRGWDGGLVRAMEMSVDFYEGARRVRKMSCHDIDPRNFPEDMEEGSVPKINAYFILSMAYRESRLAKRIELGEKLGAKGERGMFQFLPQPNGRRGFIEGKFMPRFMEDSKRRCSPFDRGCATRGAAKALAWIRCKGIQEHGDDCTIAVFMAGYGMNRLPSPAEARHHRGPVNARRYLCGVRDDCDSIWPVSHSDDFALSL